MSGTPRGAGESVPATAGPAGGEPARRHRLRAFDLATLIAVVCVVVVTSLPRLAAFARSENEADARRLTARAMQAARANPADGERALPPELTLGALFEQAPSLQRQFRDLRVLEGGRLVRHHGYWFELVPVRGQLVLRAWPVRFARTGFIAYAALPDGTLLAHPNAKGAWSGARAPHPLSPVVSELVASGWQH